MSNVKKCRNFLFLKFLIKNKKDNKRPGFLLLEFVLALGFITVSMMAMSHLFFCAVQTQLLAARKAELINVLVEGGSSSLSKKLVIKKDQALLAFSPQAQRAWHKRWAGRLSLSDVAITVHRKSIQCTSGNFFNSMTMTAIKRSRE